jgi:uncharacterized membrane protein YesL
MEMMNGRIYKVMEFIMNAFLLNILWLVMCLPILTVFPATTAMFGVVRAWQKQGDIQIFSDFFRIFRENFKQSLLIGFLWMFLAGLLLGDFIIINHLNANMKYTLFPFFLFLGILYLFVSIYIFPVMVHYQVSWKNAIKNALLFSVSYLHYSILSILIIIGAFALCFYIPAAMMLSFSIGAYLIYSIVSRGFHIEKKVHIS